MFVFIDESGDSGLKLKEGSSQLFVVSMVIFESADDALVCDQKIGAFRDRLGWSRKSEFHYKNNSDRVREQFINLVAEQSFFYYAIVLNKSKLWGEGLKNKESFYKYACRLVFENAKEKLDGATVIIDESGSSDFKSQLAKYLKSHMNGTSKRIKKIKMQRSNANNLLQLADYVASIVSHSIGNKRNARSIRYRRLLSMREMYVQIWPR